MDELSGTKELIFDAFVELASTMGYENVSTREIARKVGINSASIYYHFENKATILQCAYDYYAEHQYDNRKSLDFLKSVVETASAEEIINTMAYTFETDDEKMYVRMILITKIVYTRLFQDPVANKIFLESDFSNIEFTKDVLQHGVDVGRIDTDFDVATFAYILVSSTQVMGVKSFASPTYQVAQLEEEGKILAMLSRLLAAVLK